MKLSLIFYPQVTGGYTVICPEISRASNGDTYEEAQSNIKDLIHDFFENDSVAGIEDYIEAYNTGNKIITEIEV